MPPPTFLFSRIFLISTDIREKGFFVHCFKETIILSLDCTFSKSAYPLIIFVIHEISLRMSSLRSFCPFMDGQFISYKDDQIRKKTDQILSVATEWLCLFFPWTKWPGFHRNNVALTWNFSENNTNGICICIEIHQSNMELDLQLLRVSSSASFPSILSK